MEDNGSAKLGRVVITSQTTSQKPDQNECNACKLIWKHLSLYSLEKPFLWPANVKKENNRKENKRLLRYKNNFPVKLELEKDLSIKMKVISTKTASAKNCKNFYSKKTKRAVYKKLLSRNIHWNMSTTRVKFFRPKWRKSGAAMGGFFRKMQLKTLTSFWDALGFQRGQNCVRVRG